MTQSAPAAFFSYSRGDSSFVVDLAADLKAAGANVWLDQLDIIPGQRWDRAIEDALKNTLHLIVILSPTSVESTNVMDEVSFALEEHKTVIPVIYKDCEIPFRLRRLQYVDFRQDYAQGLKELLKVLAPQREPVRSVRDQIRPEIFIKKEGETEAEQGRLERKRQKAPEQPQVELDRRQTPAQEWRLGFFTKFPPGAKIGAGSFAILIVAFLLYLKLPHSNNKTEETSKRDPQVETTKPASGLAQPKEENQNQEPEVKTTVATPPKNAKTQKLDQQSINPEQAAEILLLDTKNNDAVQDGPTRPTEFEIHEPFLVTWIWDYHWNGGRGTTPGNISLRRSDGQIFGPWEVTAADVQSKISWECRPNARIPPGKYAVIDSDSDSWSWNSRTGGMGMTKVKGRPVR